MTSVTVIVELEHGKKLIDNCSPCVEEGLLVTIPGLARKPASPITESGEWAAPQRSRTPAGRGTPPAEAGLRPASGPVSRLDLALDTPDRKQVMPFWEAVFGLARDDNPDSGSDLTDPGDELPDLWFQQSGDEEPRQRWHHDLWIDPAQVQPRIDAAIAAGGRLVSDEQAPAYWILADPEGNKICLCTWHDFC